MIGLHVNCRACTSREDPLRAQHLLGPPAWQRPVRLLAFTTQLKACHGLMSDSQLFSRWATDACSVDTRPAPAVTSTTRASAETTSALMQISTSEQSAKACNVVLVMGKRISKQLLLIDVVIETQLDRLAGIWPKRGDSASQSRYRFRVCRAQQ